MSSLGNPTGKEQKHRGASLRTPSVAARRTRQGVPFPPPLRTLVVVQVTSRSASNQLEDCYEAKQSNFTGDVSGCMLVTEGSNCCKERLERDSLGTSKFRQPHKNNQREKTAKEVGHSNTQPGN